MGWESCPGTKTPKEWVEKELINLYSDNFTVVDNSIRGNQVYFAICHKETNKTSALVATFRRERKILWVKVIPECWLPYHYNCPARILNQLSPVDDEYSNSWRRRCFEKLRLKKEKRGHSYEPMG